MPESLDASVIIDALKAKANSVLASAVGSTPLEAFAITSLGNFPYNWQDTLNVTQFNAPTYQWISSNLKAGASPLQLDGSFTNFYIQALSAISWSLSKSDQALLNTAAANATKQAAAVQNAWIQAFGKLPVGTNPINDIAKLIATTWASQPTTLMAIRNSLNLTTLLDLTPASGQAVLPVFVNWLNAIGAQLSLQNNVTMNNGYLARALAAAQNATSDNGGLLLNNGTTAPAYQVANQNSDIQNALASGSPISMSMTVTRSTESEFTVSVEGKTGFDIPILDFLSIGIGGNASYFSSDLATTDNETTVEMSFPGVNLVNFGPVPFTQTGASSSWYWIDPIRQAIANGSNDVSGFKFSPLPPIDFSDAGPFGFLMGAAISGYPTITITIKSASYQKIQKTFQQTVSSSVSFLGIQLASASESTYSNDVTVDTANSTVTITLAPPQELVAGTVNASQAWVLGVQPNYPAA